MQENRVLQSKYPMNKKNILGNILMPLSGLMSQPFTGCVRNGVQAEPKLTVSYQEIV